MSERDLAREVAERHLPAGITVKECRQTVGYGVSCAREALLEAAKVAAEWGEGPSTMHLTIGEFANRYGEHDCLYDVLRALAGERDDG